MVVEIETERKRENMTDAEIVNAVRVTLAQGASQAYASRDIIESMTDPAVLVDIVYSAVRGKWGNFS